jgi:hypothetical protein
MTRHRQGKGDGCGGVFSISRKPGHSSVMAAETGFAHIPEAQKQEAMDKLPY